MPDRSCHGTSSALSPLNDFTIHQYLRYLELLISPLTLSLVAWHGTLIPPALLCYFLLSSLPLQSHTPHTLITLPPYPILPYPILPYPMLFTLPITLLSPLPSLPPSPIFSPLPCLTNPFPNSLIYFSI